MRYFAEHLRLGQPGDLALAAAERAQDLGVVLAERGGPGGGARRESPTGGARCCASAGCRPRVRDLDQGLALGDIWIHREIGLVADRPDRDLGVLEKSERFGLGARRR